MPSDDRHAAVTRLASDLQEVLTRRWVAAPLNQAHTVAALRETVLEPDGVRTRRLREWQARIQGLPLIPINLTPKHRNLAEWAYATSPVLMFVAVALCLPALWWNSWAWRTVALVPVLVGLLVSRRDPAAGRRTATVQGVISAKHWVDLGSAGDSMVRDVGTVQFWYRDLPYEAKDAAMASRLDLGQRMIVHFDPQEFGNLTADDDQGAGDRQLQRWFFVIGLVVITSAWWRPLVQ